MKTGFIVLGIIYLVIAFLAFIVQIAISLLVGIDSDQSELMNPFDVLKQSLQWPVILIRLVVG